MSLKLVTTTLMCLALLTFAGLAPTLLSCGPALAQGSSTGLTTGNLTAVPTINCIGVEATYTGDANGNANATLQYRVHGTSTWYNGLPMAKEANHLTWAGSAIGLAGNTTYDLQVTFADADGLSGTNPLTGNCTTRPETYNLGIGNSYYVSTTGNDSAAGTLANPWKTIQYAASTVTSGATVYIESGTYHEAVEISENSGADYARMISFVAYDPNNKPVISGANATIEANAGNNIWTSGGNNTWYTSWSIGLPGYVAAGDTQLFQYHDATEWALRGTGDYAGLGSEGYYWNSSNNTLYIQLPNNGNPNADATYSPIHVDESNAALFDAGFSVYGSDYIRFRNLDIRYYQYGIATLGDYNYGGGNKTSSYGIVEDCYINHCISGVFIADPVDSNNSPSIDWLAQDNTFYNNGASNWPWNCVKGITYRYGEGNGVGLWGNGQGTVIRRNTSNGMFDGIANGDIAFYGDDGNTTFPYIRDVDIYSNLCENCGDDGIANTGTNTNTRIWLNITHDSRTSVSARPVVVGPMYVFYNTSYNLNGSGSGLSASVVAYKDGCPNTAAGDNGRIFYFNNTIYDNSTNGVSAWYNQEYGSATDNWVSRNNAIVLTSFLIVSQPVYSGTIFDYDNLYTSKSSDIIRFYSYYHSAWGYYDTWAAFVAGEPGEEAHGLNNSGAQCLFVDPANGNFSLQASSPLIDAGMVIPGLNDANSEFAYLGSAPDIGAFEYNGGVTPTPTPTPTIIPTPTATVTPTPTPTPSPSVSPGPSPSPTPAPTANAQEFQLVPPEIANVLVKVAVIIDGVLGHWVSGNALTVDGGGLVGSIAQTVVNTVHFLAELVTLF